MSVFSKTWLPTTMGTKSWQQPLTFIDFSYSFNALLDYFLLHIISYHSIAYQSISSFDICDALSKEQLQLFRTESSRTICGHRNNTKNKQGIKIRPGTNENLSSSPLVVTSSNSSYTLYAEGSILSDTVIIQSLDEGLHRSCSGLVDI